MDELEEEQVLPTEEVAPQEEDPSVFLDVAQAPFRGVEGALHGAYNLADMVAFDVLPDWDTRFLGTSKTTAGSLVEGISQFATGFVPIFGAAGRIGALAKAGKIARGVAAGAVTDFAVFKGQEDRLSNLIQQYPELQNPVTEFLAHDADETEVEGRLKNVLEGLILEGAIGGTVSLFMKSLRALKAGKKARDVDGLGPDEVNKATSDSLEGGRVFVDDEAQIAARRQMEEDEAALLEGGIEVGDIPEVDLSKVNWDEVDLEDVAEVAPAVAREEMEAIEAGGRLIDERETATALVKTYEMPGGSKRTVMVDKANPGQVVDLNRYMIAAFHGTPHVFKPKPEARFGAFEKSKIGTGEGAQKFGHGFYFAESEDVSKFYYRKEIYNHFARDLEDAGVVLDPFYMDDPYFNFDTINQLIEKGITEEGVKIEPRKIKFLKELRDEDWLGFDEPTASILAAFDDVFNKTNNYDLPDSLKKAAADLGRIYKVEIKAKNEEFLLWDKPIESMPSKVQQIIKGAADGIRDFDKSFPKDVSLLTGENFYKLLSRSSVIKNQQAASDFLSEMGIPGIRYLEGGKARKTGEGAHNYVVFNEKDVKVTGTVDFAPPSGFGTEIDPKTKEFLLKGAEARELKEKGFKETRTEAGVLRERIKPKDLDETPTVSNTLDQLTKNAKSPEVRNLAKGLKEIITDPEDLNVPIKYDPEKDGRGAAGRYALGTDDIELFKEAGEEALVHEILHGVTTRKLAGHLKGFYNARMAIDPVMASDLIKEAKAPKPVRELSASYLKAFEHPSIDNKLYPMSDLDEFLVGAFTDKKLQELLSKIPVEDNRNLFQKLVDAVANLIGVKGDGNLLNKVIRDSAEIISGSRKELAGSEFPKVLLEPSFRYSRGVPDFKAKLKTDPEWQQWTDAVLKGESPTLPRLEVIGDIDSAHKILTEKYKQNPELLKKFDEGESDFLDEDLNQLFKLGAQSIKDRRRIRVESEIFKDLLRGSNEKLMQAVKAFDDTESLQSEAALRNQLSEFVEIYDYYRQMGAEDSKNLAMRRQKKPMSRKIGLERSELENTALVKEFLNNESGGMSPKKASKLIKEMYDPNNAEASIKKILGLSKKTQGKHLLDVPSEYWINSLLSGPRTQAVNFLGNALTQALGTFEMTTGAILTGNLPLAKAAIASWADYVLWKEAFSAAFKTLVTGKEVLDVGSRTLESSRQAIGDVVDLRQGLDESKSFNQKFIDTLGGVVNLPARGLLTGDELFKQLAFRRAARLKAGMEAINLGMKDPKEISGYIADKLNKVVATNGQVMSQEALIREATKQADDLGLVGVQFAKQRSDHIKNYVDQNFDEDASVLASYALDEAKYFTHTRELEEGTLGKGLQNLSKSWPLLRFIMPFVRTPTNLLSFAFERSPLSMSVKVPGTDKILNVPGLRSEAMALREGFKSSDPVIKAATRGKVVTSFSVAGMLLDLVLNNNEVLPVITGGGPTEERQRKILEETGWRPYSILYDGKYYSYQRLDPIATLLGTTADISEMLKEDKEANENTVETQLVTMATAISRNLSNKSYLAGIQLWADAFQEPERFGERVLKNYAGSSIPNIFSQAQDYDKQSLREVRDVADAILKKTPGGRDMLDPKRNILGEEKIIDYGTFGFINPIAIAEDKSDPILQEMAELQHGFRMPSSKMLGGNVDLLEYANEKGQSAYDRRLELLKDVTIGGRTLRQALNKLINSSSYKKLAGFDAELGIRSPRVDQISKVLDKYKNIAQREMLREFPELASKIRNTNLALRYNKQGVSREDVLALLSQ